MKPSAPPINWSTFLTASEKTLSFAMTLESDSIRRWESSRRNQRIGVDRIDHVHVKDAPENLVGCWPLGKGSGKFLETMNLLKELGYSGWYVAENYFYQPPMSQLGTGWDLAKNDLDYLHRLCESQL